MKTLLRLLLDKLGYSIQCIRHVPQPLLDPANLRSFEFDDAVARRMTDVGERLTFVQVGVYDGTTHDPLRKHILKHGWTGVMVEPQTRSVEGLRLLYRDHPGIRIVNAAVDAQPGERILYTVEGPNAPDWAGGLASFDRATVAKHEEWCPGLSAMIREETVTCLPFVTILADLPDRSIDILQIDTEGADGHILSLFPFERVRPAIVHFEIKHLNTEEQERAFRRLVSHGYKLSRSGGEDMLAVQF